MVTGIAGIHSGPRHVILYTSNGEVRQEFSIVLTARPLAGRPTPGSESSEVRRGPASEVLGYTMDRSMRIRMDDALAHWSWGAPVALDHHCAAATVENVLGTQLQEPVAVTMASLALTIARHSA